MELHTPTRLKGNKKPAKRIGRGIGSGVGGHTVGRGQKGQKSRTGYNIPRGFEGGQVPLYKKLPQIGGFKNKFRNGIKILSTDKFVKKLTFKGFRFSAKAREMVEKAGGIVQ